ncbi:MAG: SDR family NAD(P)-dependent oxidoreductase [Ilumatobacteraceae bacterium]
MSPADRGSRRFAGRRALVTGASRGIGVGIAERLAAEGAHVAISARTVDHHDRLPGSLNETLARLRGYGTTVAAIAADLADAEARAAIVPAAAKALGGPIDILVNNAAAAVYAPLREYPLKRRRMMFEINVNAPVDLAQAVIPAMVAAGEGWIINVSSGSARQPGGPPFKTDGVALVFGVYGASKAALNRITGAMAAELYGTGIRVNTIEPRAAVLSEGADAVMGTMLTAEQIEPLEAMVEATIALCCCPVEHTGRIEVSLDLLEREGIPVRTLDATGIYADSGYSSG